MKNEHRGLWLSRISCTLAAAAIAATVAGTAGAQTVRIRYRPLSPQEIKDYGMTNTTQKSGGAPNAGIGQPVYIEALVSNSLAAAVTSVTWTLTATPPGSSFATNTPLDPGPIGLSVPAGDTGDRFTHTVVSRAMIRPDVVSSYDFGASRLLDYRVRTEVFFTNTVNRQTNVVYGAVYIGQKQYLCVLCHADKQANFDLTDHATAFTRQITGEGSDHFNPNCISCHTLGYDVTPGATNGGFDDVAAQVNWTFPGTFSPTNWTGMNTNLQLKSNVQCESCHGPASAHMVSLGFTNAIDVTLSAGTCSQCHDSMPFHVKDFEWEQSRHATGFVFRFSGSCIPCHSSRGFIETWDPYYTSTNKTPRGTVQEGIACAACHDPHTPGMGDKQLRAITTASLSNGVVLTYAQAGTGVLCMNCHHSRQSATIQVASTNSISPHYGVQGDMLAGENGFEYGLNMPSSRHMTAVTNSCVGCHMQLVAGTSFSNSLTKVGGHTFRISWDGGTTNTTADDVQVTEVCGKCHVENTFDIVAEDYDRDGVLEGVQTETRGLLDQLALLIPPAGTGVTYSASFSPALRRAFWNYMFVVNDQSLGVHNPKYTAALLQASIDDLNGGIDIDRDGLADAWEMANFGSLTAQTGSGDADNDGVTNELEEDIGTNPNLADSDADTVSDLAELQGGTDPLSSMSSVPTNTVFQMMGAMELGYMPGQSGVTQVFQAVDAMGDGGGWANVGAPFVSSNAVQYQLISLRDTTQRYFRVVRP